MAGASAGDVAAMDEANLSLTLRNSKQAALSMTDIILLEDSFEVLPAMVTMTLAALLISGFFRRTIDDIPYSELAVTLGLIVMGPLLIIFVQPSTRFFIGGDVLSADWRSTYMAVVLLILFVIATYLPITQEWLRLAPLDSAQDYLIIWLYLSCGR